MQNTMPPATPALATNLVTEKMHDALRLDYPGMMAGRLDRGACIERTGKCTQWWEKSNDKYVTLKARCLTQSVPAAVLQEYNYEDGTFNYCTRLLINRLSESMLNKAATKIRETPEWSTIRAHAFELDSTDFGKCEVVQRLAPRTIGIIELDLGANVLVPRKWLPIAMATCDCGDHTMSDDGRWCKHVAALICSLIRKLNKDLFLWLAILGLDVHRLAAPQWYTDEEPDEEAKTPAKKVKMEKGESPANPIDLSD